MQWFSWGIEPNWFLGRRYLNICILCNKGVLKSSFEPEAQLYLKHCFCVHTNMYSILYNVYCTAYITGHHHSPERSVHVCIVGRECIRRGYIHSRYIQMGLRPFMGFLCMQCRGLEASSATGGKSSRALLEGEGGLLAYLYIYIIHIQYIYIQYICTYTLNSTYTVGRNKHLKQDLNKH